MTLDRSDIRSAVKVGLWILGFLVLVEIIYPAPTSILVLGLVNGSLSGLIAVGLVLVYRANRIVNFAQFDIGGAIAVLTALLIGKGMNFFPAALIGLVTAIALGALIEIVFIRRFAKAPRLQLTVATIGIAQLFQVIE
ncbi:MAG: branched-chain amino acid transport system permease protein livM [Acidimicrobiaceae bacterium]|jgi:branched-chain amino acid transport system permease protein